MATDPLKSTVDADAFTALDIRIGRVTAVEPFPEARDPAWKLTVDFGPDIGARRTSAKIRNYRSDALLGRQVVGVLNLGVRRIAGFDSDFLVIGGLDADGAVSLLGPDRDLPPGSPVA